MRLLSTLLALTFLLPFADPDPAHAQDPCGAEAPCVLEGGSYHLLLPPGWQDAQSLPAVIYYHGHRSSGASVFRGGQMQRTFADGGYVVIAPNGVPIGEGSSFRWPARPLPPDQRDDVAFSLAVLADAQARVPALDPGRVYAAGFSAGGSMAWMLGCYAGETLAGVVSVAGALRRPNPAGACPSGPIRVLHIHGFADPQVPLEGRGIGDWHQGDVFESLTLARASNACRSNPDRITTSDRFACRVWEESCASAAVAYCQHPGRHSLPRGWATLARDWFEGRAPLGEE